MRATPSRLAGYLGIEVPLLCAGMGGVAGPELAAAVAEAGGGGGGVFGLYRADGEALRRLIEQARGLTRRPYGVNLIPEVSGSDYLARQVDQVLRWSSPDIFVTFFGLPPVTVSESLKWASRRILVQVGDVAQARAAVSVAAACDSRRAARNPASAAAPAGSPATPAARCRRLIAERNSSSDTATKAPPRPAHCAAGLSRDGSSVGPSLAASSASTSRLPESPGQSW